MLTKSKFYLFTLSVDYFLSNFSEYPKGGTVSIHKKNIQSIFFLNIRGKLNELLEVILTG